MSAPASSPSPAVALAVSPKTACRMLDIGTSHLYKLLRAGELDDFHSGRTRRITTRSIEAYVQRQVDARASTSARPPTLIGAAGSRLPNRKRSRREATAA
jgi:excisionase family DNA binding protein